MSRRKWREHVKKNIIEEIKKDPQRDEYLKDITEYMEDDSTEWVWMLSQIPLCYFSERAFKTTIQEMSLSDQESVIKELIKDEAEQLAYYENSLSRVKFGDYTANMTLYANENMERVRKRLLLLQEALIEMSIRKQYQALIIAEFEQRQMFEKGIINTIEQYIGK